ncbi:MAG: cytidine deaminase [Candidatus Korobacteraceae bacterium]
MSANPNLHSDLNSTDLEKAYSNLSATERDLLIKTAQEVRNRAYAHYSKFRVGAAVLTQSGRIFAGCNVENSSYRLTTCAEQAAISNAVAQEGKNMKIRAVAVTAGEDIPCSPCGACRQMIFEFGPDARVLFSTKEGEADWSIEDLLPEGFRLNE